MSPNDDLREHERLRGFRTVAWLPGLLACMSSFVSPSVASSQPSAEAPPLVSPADLAFGGIPIEPIRREIRWITEPDSTLADTGYVYMDVDLELRGRDSMLVVDWHPYFGNLPNEDVIAVDPRNFGVWYRTLPGPKGSYGIYWYLDDGPAYGAQVDSLGMARRHEIELVRPVFSIPTFHFLLSRLAQRRDDPFRIEQVSWRADGPAPGSRSSSGRSTSTNEE